MDESVHCDDIKRKRSFCWSDKNEIKLTFMKAAAKNRDFAKKNLVERRRRKNLRITSKPIETVPIRKIENLEFPSKRLNQFF